MTSTIASVVVVLITMLVVTDLAAAERDGLPKRRDGGGVRLTPTTQTHHLGMREIHSATTQELR